MLKQISSSLIPDLSTKAFQRVPYYTWGIQDSNGSNMDYNMPLLEQARFVIMAGAQGSGKTTWSIEMAKQNAVIGKEKGYKVAYLSLEMDAMRMATRYAERQVPITKHEKMDGFIPEELERKKVLFEEAFKSFCDSGLYLLPPEDQKAHSLSYIQEICADEYGPRVLFIDNLAEITPDDDKITSEYEKFDIVIRTLNDICKHTETTIVLLHHLNKPSDKEIININSIKGNNIVITKADIVVCLDKHLAPNPNWRIEEVGKDGQYIPMAIKNKFLSYAPLIKQRKIEVFKDRDWDETGVVGYMELVQGAIVRYDLESLRSLHPLNYEEKKRYLSLINEKSYENWSSC